MIKSAQKTLAKAKAKFLNISPFKLRRVANVVRGKSVDQAVMILNNLPHRGAKLIKDVVLSCAANAVNNNKMSRDNLVVSQLLIDEGPRHKRFQPRARGRIYQIMKRTSHVTVSLAAREGVQ